MLSCDMLPDNRAGGARRLLVFKLPGFVWSCLSFGAGPVQSRLNILRCLEDLRFAYGSRRWCCTLSVIADTNSNFQANKRQV